MASDREKSESKAKQQQWLRLCANFFSVRAVKERRPRWDSGPSPPRLLCGLDVRYCRMGTLAPFNVLIPPFILHPEPGSLSRTKKAAVIVSSPPPRCPAINAAAAANSHLLLQLPSSLFSSSLRFFQHTRSLIVWLKRVFVFQCYRCCWPGHFIGISLFSAFMPYGYECVKWTASLLGGPQHRRPTPQCLIRGETLSTSVPVAVWWWGAVQVRFRGFLYKGLRSWNAARFTAVMLPHGVQPEPHRSVFHPWSSFPSHVTDQLLLSLWLKTKELLLSGRFTQMGTSAHLLPPLALSRLRSTSQIVWNLILVVESPEQGEERQMCV